MLISGLRFLAVEDHEFQRGLLLKMLAGLGATGVRAAADGRAALMIVRSQTPPVDIVISDLDMPGMDGMEFMRHLGESGFPVSIILVSALGAPLLASVETMTRAYGVRILGVIAKPVTPEKLEALIRVHLEDPPDHVRGGAAAQTFELDEIVEALQNDEFEPFFQPKVSMASGHVTGAEALARWHHPQEGIVLPAAFLAPLEDGGKIDLLTGIMVRRAAAFCKQWHASGSPEATVSVNLSMKSLADVHLAERITELVHAASLEPKFMILEVTESSTSSDSGAALETLSRLRMKGFGLSIDDYGSGSASIQPLTRIAFTELKISRTLVANALTQQAAEIVLESSLTMAKRLGISSVCSGIETEDQRLLVRQLGCEVAQGYLIGRPAKAASFLKWVKDRPLG